jgi:hypothetical protein
MGMFTRRKNSGSYPSILEPENRLLRLLRSGTGFRARFERLERADEEDGYDEARKEIINVMLEAEYKKAKAIMMMEQHSKNFC